MKTKDEIRTAAENQGLKIKEVTHAFNDYPQNLGDMFIVGFENMESANKFAENNSGEVGLGDIKAGGHFYHYRGWRNETLTSDDYLNDLGDNYHESNKDMIVDYFADQLKDLADEFDGDFEAIESFISDQKEIMEAIEDADDNEVVIVGHGKYYETVPNEMMTYQEDVTTYSMGVYFSKNDLLKED